MTLGEGFYFDFGQVRLFADREVEGWVAGLYDLKQHKWIYWSGWKYDSAQEAQEEAKKAAEQFLSQSIDPAWCPCGPTQS